MTQVFGWIDTWQGISGKIHNTSSASLPFDQNGIKILVGGAASHINALTYTDAKSLAKSIDALAIGSDHLEVKNNVVWRSLYQMEDRDYPFMDINGQIADWLLSTIPCHNCGMVVPESQIQIDHHMPQKDGEDLYTLKMARAQGLTTAAPSGSKGQAAANLAGLIIHPIARNIGDYDHLANATASAKWTTNDKGTAFLSMFASIGALGDLQRICKNTLLNLVPLCGECNRVKSDWVKPII